MTGVQTCALPISHKRQQPEGDPVRERGHYVNYCLPHLPAYDQHPRLEQPEGRGDPQYLAARYAWHRYAARHCDREAIQGQADRYEENR